MSFKVERVEQITAVLENRPGILADLCAELAERGVNIRAMAATEAVAAGSVRLVVDDTELAKKTLAEAGVPVNAASCLALEMPNHPGSFERLARILSLAGINIDSMYGSAPSSTGQALAILDVSDLDRALSLDWDAR